MGTATHYTASNALAKLERDHPHRTEEITAMRAEIQAREARNDQAS